MKNQDLIHLKFEYEDALEAKKTILQSEKGMMLVAKTMNNYKELRKIELKKKITLARKLKEAINLIKKLQKETPKVDVPGITEEKETQTTTTRTLKKNKPTKRDNSVESQLRDIQEKLRALGN
ncbi:hypothetical protein COU59_02535 [Candidatus Pacearchaeota archaeon CG10_big_fil_rev_8_21_14_0_10_34_12]|nr:MAG: hypothetical protein COU59_02535 [Candidatus Pacearchaeota archaeon CG10_big_fil_rev_8_21_14_0_10_34_12]